MWFMYTCVEGMSCGGSCIRVLVVNKSRVTLCILPGG